MIQTLQLSCVLQVCAYVQLHATTVSVSVIRQA